MKLKFSQLALFCALVEEGSIHAAAVKMHCVPSNISSRIKELELHLEINLFQHHHRKLIITPEGRSFYQQAKVLLAYADQCQQLFESERMVGVLNIGVASTALTHFTELDSPIDQHLQMQIIHFLKQHTQVQLNIESGDTHNLVDRLVNIELDLILSGSAIQHPQLKSQLLYAEPMYVLSHHAHLDDFKRHAADEIFFHHEHHADDLTDISHWLAQSSNTAVAATPHLSVPMLQRQCHIASYALIFAAIQQQLGYALIPHRFLSKVKQQKLYAYPLVHRGHRAKHMVYVLWNRHRQSKLIQQFIHAITQHPPNMEDALLNSVFSLKR